MAKKWDFEDFKGDEVWFYGVDNCHFKIDYHVFEAIEDESDGHRSYLESIAVTGLPGMLIFRNEPLAKVRVEEVDDDYFEGWHLIDVRDGHVWLKVGTNIIDDHYPSFVFEYQPKQGRGENFS